jgi:hypothetical protein
MLWIIDRNYFLPVFLTISYASLGWKDAYIHGQKLLRLATIRIVIAKSWISPIAGHV